MTHTGRFQRIEIYHNKKGEMPEAIKAKTGCTTIINGIMFNGDGSLCGDIRKDGVWIGREGNTVSGIGWSGNEIPGHVQTKDAERFDNFLTCFEVANNVKRGRAAIGFRGDTYIALAVSDSMSPMTIPETHAMMKQRCDIYLILDGGGSVYLESPSGKVDTSPARKTRNKTYLLIWERGEQKKDGEKMKVCLDPGHGTREMNQSPDGRYIEHEFALDMANRIRAHLVRCGVDVKLTREDSSTPSLTDRANIANAYKADLFVSLHSNAVSGGWSDNTRGFTVWTYAAGGERDRAAKLLLAEMKQAGVQTFGAELYHQRFTVLAKTNMPAYLIEYAFHTSRPDVALLLDNAHRDKLALSTAKAICAWGGVKWVEPVAEPQEPADGTIYRVQVGAFTGQQNAENLKAELEGKGYKPFIAKEEKA